MPGENPTPSVPKADNQSPADPPLLGDKKFTPHVYVAPKTRRKVIILIVAAIAIVGGVLLWRYLGTYESTDDAQADVHLYPVSARVSGYVVHVNGLKKAPCWWRSTQRTTKSPSRRPKPTSPAPRPPRNR
jgi:hypothetical protein